MSHDLYKTLRRTFRFGEAEAGSKGPPPTRRPSSWRCLTLHWHLLSDPLRWCRSGPLRICRNQP